MPTHPFQGMRYPDAAQIAQGPGSRITGIANTYSGATKMWSSAAGIGAASTVTLTLNTAYYTLFWWPWNFVPNLIGIEITTLAALAKMRCGVWAMGADFSFGARLGLATDLDAANTGIKTGTITPGSSWYGPGLYWVGCCDDTAGVIVRASSTTQGLGLLPHKVGQGTIGGWSKAETYATSLPDPGPTISALSSVLGAGPTVLLGVA